MRVIALLSLLFAAAVSAAPVITSVEPPVGFTYAPTRVTIHGSDLVTDDVICPILPPGGTGQGTCPVQVFFGGDLAFVLSATPTRIEAYTNPFVGGQPRIPGPVDVRVVIEGKGETTLANGFRFDNAPFPDPAFYSPVLVPLTTANDVRGANGSIWRTELRVFNNSAWPLALDGPLCNPEVLAPCGDPTIPAGRTESIELYPGPIEGTDGAFLWGPNPLVGAAHMSLRVRDISENAQSWGTAIPIVKPNDFATRLVIIDVPTDARYRGMLRIYSEGASPQTVEYRVFRENDDEPILTRRVELHGIVHPAPVLMLENLTYIQIDLLTPEVRAAGERVWIEIDNLGANVSPPPPSIWAFVSVTNNESQQITVMVP